MNAQSSTRETLAQLDKRFAEGGLPHLHTLGLWQGQSATVGAQLWTAQSLDFIVARYTEEYGASDRRALLSHWSKSYLEALLPGALAACLLLDRELPLAFSDIGLQLNAEGSVANILLTAQTSVIAADADFYHRCRLLLQTNLEPFVDGLARHGRISARALWGNVAGYIAWALRMLAAQMGLSTLVLQQAIHVFSTPLYPDSRPNPVQQAYQFPDEVQLQPWRRVCCLRYCIPDLPYCRDCPLARRELKAKTKNHHQ